MSLFSQEGWEDKRLQLDDERSKLKQWTYLVMPDQNEESLVSTAQVGCPKTDVGMKRFRSLKTMLVAKEIVGAAELSAAEQADVADVLLIYLSMVFRSQSQFATIASLAYLYDSSLLGAKDDQATMPFRAFVRSCGTMLELVRQIVVSEQSVRDGDEEYMPVQIGRDIIGSVVHDIKDVEPVAMLEELDAAVASEKCSAELKVRLAVQRATLATLWHFHNVNADDGEKKEEGEKKEDAPAEAAAAAAAATAAKKEKPDLSLVLKALNTALTAWHRDAAHAEPVFNPKVFTENALLWANGNQLGAKFLKPVAFSAGKDFFKALHRDLSTVLGWRAQKLGNKDLYAVVKAVRAFSQTPPAAIHTIAATAEVTPGDCSIPVDPQTGLPGLLARSLAARFLFDLGTGKVLGQRLVTEMLAHTLDVFYGAPLYEHVLKDHHEITSAIIGAQQERQIEQVRLYLQATGKKMTQAELEKELASPEVKERLREQMEELVLGAAQCVIEYINAMLHTRSRCHRIMNSMLLPNISMRSQQLTQLDMLFNCRPAASSEEVSKIMGDEKQQRHLVVVHLLNDLIFEIADHVLNAEMTLGLAAPAEIPALLFYRFVLGKHRQMNMSRFLFLEAETLALSGNKAATASESKRKLVVQYGAGAVFRQPRPMPPHVNFNTLSTTHSANISFLAVTALAPALATNFLVQPLTSLMSTEVAFMRRVAVIRRAVPMGEAFLPSYAQVRNEVTGHAANPVGTLTNAVNVLSGLLPIAKAQVEKDAGANTMRAVHVADKLGRENLVVLKLAMTLATVGGSKTGMQEALKGYELSVDYSLEFPAMLHFSLKKKQL